MARTQEKKFSLLTRLAARLSNDDLADTRVRAGQTGEQVVGSALERLVHGGWLALHAIPWPSGSDIDHLVIGPAGVFTVNSKHHPGAGVWVGDATVKVSGSSTDYLRNALTERDRVAAVLRHWRGTEVPVQPVIAFVGARGIKLATQRPKALVLDGADIDQTLAGAPAILPPHEVRHLYDIARRRSIWQSAGRLRRGTS